MATLISGTIALPAGTEAFSGATLYIVLEEIGMMDAPAQVAAQGMQRNVAYDGAPIPFSLEGDPPSPDGTYNLRVLVSRSGGSEIRQGDFITKRRYRVLENGAPDRADVAVERV